MKAVKRYLLSLVTIAIIFMISASTGKVNANIKADNGVLNLSQWNFGKSGRVMLQGKWDLYYGELLKPEEIKMRKVSSYYNIPGRLSDQVPGKNQGYMTLHLKITVPRDEVYGIYFNSLFTSSDIWINGVYEGGHGRVGESAMDERPIYRPQYIYAQSANKEIDIVIHTSTYVDLQPSLKAAFFGTKMQIEKLSYKNVALDGIVIGILFILGILSFSFYFTKPKKKGNIYFSIICFLMILRCLMFGSRLAVEFFPDMPYEVLSKTAAVTFYLCITFYILFLNDIFDNRIAIKNVSIAYGAGFTVLCTFTNNNIYDRAGIFAQIFVALLGIYLFTFFIKEIYKRNYNAGKSFLPFLVICLTTLHDILVNDSVLNSTYFVLYAVVVLGISQLIFIVDDYFEKHRKLGDLNRDGLTSLYNNKYIKELLAVQLKRFKQKNEKFSLLMIDIDDFKGINDTFGHMFGDTVIIDVARVLDELSEEKGYVGRLGGDEFIVILPKTIEKDAVIFAEEIMKSIDVLNKKYDIDREISVSIGVYENNVNDLSECIDNADSSMYKAKSLGKNCIRSTQM